MAPNIRVLVSSVSHLSGRLRRAADEDQFTAGGSRQPGAGLKYQLLVNSSAAKTN